MTFRVVIRSALTLTVLPAVAMVAGGQDSASTSAATSLALNASSRTGQDSWVRAASSRATVLKTRIAVDIRLVALKDALLAIAEAANITIQIGPDVLASKAVVSLHVANMSVADALATAVEGTGLTAYVSLGGDAVLVARAPGSRTDHTTKRAQEDHITGRVLDADSHTPVPAASVVVNGTTIGMTTTDSGTFTLRRPPDAKSLSARRIGYLAVTVPLVTGQSDYTISLHKDVLRLQAEVVTGVTTTVASQNAANAVAVVTTQDVNQVPAPTLENSLESKIPGALIESNNGGAPGGGLQVQIRGVTSINGNAEPLYVVDGVIVDNQTINAGENAINLSGGGQTSTGQTVAGAPSPQDNSVNRIADLNPADIENIEVLKGASASAIYGSKASAGVVIITTKKGTSGKARWDITGQVGHYAISNTYATRSFPTLASAQAWYVNDITHSTIPSAVAANNAFIQGMYAGPQDYQDQLFGNSQAAYQTNISVSGQTGGAQYFVSALSKYDNGTMLNTGYNKQSLRTNVTEQFLPSLTVTAGGNYIHDVTRRGITGNDNNGMSPYDVFSYTPEFTAMNQVSPSGNWPLNYFGPANPFADATEISTPEEVSRFIASGNINWTLWKTEHQSLQFNAVGGADLASLHDLLYAPPSLQVEQLISTGLPGVSVSNDATINYYNYSINLIHHFTGVPWLDATTSAGFVRERRDYTNPVTVGYGLLSGVNSPTVGEVTNSFFYRTGERDQSLYAQEQILTADQRLTVTGGVTAERSTIDADIGKFYAYPRYSASYRIPQFVGFLDELKLRAAYGQSGNLGPYGSKFTPYNPLLIGGTVGVTLPATLGDPDLKPESEQETELGFDATMFKSRAQFSASVYQKRLTNLLLQGGVAPSHGYSQLFLNGGEFTNQGLELSLESTPIQLRSGFTWVNQITFFRNTSVVNALPVPNFIAGGGFGSDYLAPGRSLTDVVNSNVILPSGLPIQVGDFSPGYVITMSNEYTWKGFRVYGLLDWSRGGDEINLTDQYFDFGPQLGADSAAAARRLALFGAGQQPYVETASFLKVRELVVSYNLPPHLVERIGFGRVSTARLSLDGYNLWAIFNYHGLDPQVASNGNLAVGRGTDITPYPPARSYFLGLDLGL
jgi:TonB-linked SusC/RagA family outer membrane protein